MGPHRQVLATANTTRETPLDPDNLLLPGNGVGVTNLVVVGPLEVLDGLAVDGGGPDVTGVGIDRSEWVEGLPRQQRAEGLACK